MTSTSSLTALPRGEVSPHKQVIETCHTNQLEKLRDDLMYDGFLHVVALQAAPYLVEEVQYIIHAERRLRVGVHKTVEESATAIGGSEARQRLAFDKSGNNHLGQPLLRFRHPGVIDVVLKTIQVVLDNRDETFVVFPLKWPYCILLPGTDTLQHVAFSNTNEREHFVDVRQPEDARLYRVFTCKRLRVVLVTDRQ